MYCPYSQTYFVHICVLPIDGISLSFIKNILSWIKSQEAGPETDTLVEVIYSENALWENPVRECGGGLRPSKDVSQVTFRYETHKKAETEP